MTEWRDIPGFEGCFQASSEGDIRSLDRIIDDGHGRPRKVRGRVLSPGAGRFAYLTVHIRTNAGIRGTQKVHRLVAMAFHGLPPFPRAEVCHNDGDPRNNRAANLRWDSRSANGVDSVKHGSNIHAKKTHCPQGHEYTAANTELYGPLHNRRRCRICQKEHNRRYYLRKKGIAA